MVVLEREELGVRGHVEDSERRHDRQDAEGPQQKSRKIKSLGFIFMFMIRILPWSNPSP